MLLPLDINSISYLVGSKVCGSAYIFAAVEDVFVLFFYFMYLHL